MSIPWISDGAPLRPLAGSVLQHREWGSVAILCFLLASLALTGCSYTGGELLFLLGAGRGQMVKAEFQLTDGPILILLDDPAERIDWPASKQHIFDELGQELIRTGAAKKLIPWETIQQLQRNEPNFAERGCRELGRMAEAEQVLWLEVQDYLAEEQFYDPSNAAYLIVAVKVIDVTQEKRSQVRLWPTSPEGHLVTAKLDGNTVSIAKTKEAVSKGLAADLAQQIAKLFYDHRMGDFERAP